MQNSKIQLKNQKYEPVIGLEVHVELNTKSKMFCRCSADYFGHSPNTHTCPVCLGLPGALPYINRQAIEDCLKIGLALDCSVSEVSRFERKNYFYPDLPKSYQISQYRWPLCVSGKLQVKNNNNQDITIRINRVHQEEDTAKLTHQFGNRNYSLIDFNRSGVPLVEIVTEPDFHDVESVRNYAKKLQQLFRYLKVSNADMEKGGMRLEANISLRELKSQNSKVKSNELPNYRIELKNINSFRFMVAAIEYETKRQIGLIEKGQTLIQETRGWDEEKKQTYLQRSKEEAHDYRYFPEPDLPELAIDKGDLTKIKRDLSELPWDKAKRFTLKYGISSGNAKILTESREFADFFEDVVDKGQKQQIEPRQIAGYLVNTRIDIKSATPEKIIEQIADKQIGVIDNMGELEKLVEEVLEQNPKPVLDFKNGKTSALQALIGAVMRKTSGKADIGKVHRILKQKFAK